MLTISPVAKTRLEASEESPNLSIRLKGPEADRWRVVFKRAVRRQPFANKTDVVRALLGLPSLRPNAPALLTDQELEYFRGERHSLSVGPPQAVAEKRNHEDAEKRYRGGTK